LPEKDSMQAPIPEIGSEGKRSEVRRTGHLLRILGVGFGIAVVVGNTIGSGILLTPGEIAANLRNPWLVFAAWCMGGAFAFCCTQAVCELGTMLPRAGGWFVFSRQAFGEYGGFLVGCCDWMMLSAGTAYLSAAFGEFAAGLEPSLRGREKLASAACLLTLAMVNWAGLRWGSRTQKITSIAKAAALVAFVAACFVVTPKVAPAAAIAPPSLLTLPLAAALVAIFAALQPIVITYDGWYADIYFTEEDKNPAKNLPRASITAVLACGAIYLLVNAALLHVLPMGTLATSHIPAADAAAVIFGNHGRQVILLISMVTVVSTINATLMMAPRILFAMARQRLMPRWITAVNAGGTPSAALLLCTAVAMGLVFSGSYDTLIAMDSILYVVVYLSGFMSLFVLRVKQPDLPRPFKMWGYPWTNLGISLGAGVFLVAAIVADLKHAAFTLVVVALTYPLYLLAKRMRSSPDADEVRP
jgi:basic amino acid/polyamine antiporter, APA family